MLQDNRAWCTTDPGRQFLASLEAPILQPLETCVTVGGCVILALRSGLRGEAATPRDPTSSCRRTSFIDFKAASSPPQFSTCRGSETLSDILG